MTGPAALHLRGVVLPDEVERDVYVHDGRITFEPVPGAQTVLAGGFLLPGLVDAHCHIGMAADSGGQPPGVQLGAAQALLARDRGALLLRDAGSPVDTRPLLDSDDLPRLIRAGRHIARPKRYVRDLGVEVEPDQLVTEVEKQVAYGSGAWVKLVGDWIDRSRGDLAPLWPAAVLAAAVARAHELGARVAVHTFGEDALPDLIAAGVDSIEHGTGLAPDQLGMLADRGIAVVPTLINVDRFPGIAALGESKFPAYAAHMRALYATARERAVAAYEAGVPIFAGSDAGGGVEHGRLADEIAALHAAGIPADAALAAGSWAARAWLGLPGIEQGAPADLLGYSADPRTDLAAVGNPTRIVLRGRLVR